jgi:hypothetical protein
MISERIALDVALLLCILFLPWWVSALVAIAGLLYLRNFSELVVLSLFYDVLYGPVVHAYTGTYFFVTSVAIVALLLSSFLKRYFIFYNTRDAFNS